MLLVMLSLQPNCVPVFVDGDEVVVIGGGTGTVVDYSGAGVFYVESKDGLAQQIHCSRLRLVDQALDAKRREIFDQRYGRVEGTALIAGPIPYMLDDTLRVY